MENGCQHNIVPYDRRIYNTGKTFRLMAKHLCESLCASLPVTLFQSFAWLHETNKIITKR